MRKNKYIVCQLNGGLGNQIFQYVFLYWFKDNLNRKIILSKSDYSFLKNYYRKLLKINPSSLFEWLITDEKLNAEINLINRFKARFNDHINQSFDNIITNSFFKENLNINEEEFCKNIVKCNFLKSHCVFPQLIKFKIFSKYWEQMANFLVDKNSNKNNDYDITLHIRKTDYITYKKGRFFSNLSKEYYNNAIDLIVEKRRIQNKPRCLVIGDDLDWAKINLRDDINASYQYRSEKEDLLSLVLSNNLIIANSSFSYSAAMMNKTKNNQKIIICPKKYYTENAGFEDFKHHNWIALDN